MCLPLVNIGVLLALASLAVLIFFIHHVSQSIQAENLIADVGQDFQRMLSTFFPERVGESSDAEQAPDDDIGNMLQLTSKEHGYLERVDDEALIRLATQNDLQLRAGKTAGRVRFKRYPAGAHVAGIAHHRRDRGSAARMLQFGNASDTASGRAYSIQQLVEIAAHALSPGINEPFTALTCIDWLGGSLRGVLRRDLPYLVVMIRMADCA